MTEKFIAKSKIVHGDKYDYSLAEYTNNHIKVKIICKVHGLFEQIAKSHLIGSGCLRCGMARNKTSEQFIKDAIKIHGDNFFFCIGSFKSNSGNPFFCFDKK